MILRVKTQLLNFSTHDRVLAKTKYGRIEIKDEYLIVPLLIQYTYHIPTHSWFENINSGPIPIKEPYIELDVGRDLLEVSNNEFFDIVYTEDSTVDDYYRCAREHVCFPIINRGPLWYQHLTMSQQTDLNVWYEAWLDAPETHQFPVTPYWLDDKLQKIELEEIF